MMYILTLVLEDHSGVVRSKVKVDRLAEPSWKSDSAIRTVFLIVGLLITLLLLSMYLLSVGSCFNHSSTTPKTS